MSFERKLANQVLDVVPTLMHQIRSDIRAGYKASISVPQFRVLANIRRGIEHVGQIAEQHGVSQPAMSKMVDSLVLKGLVKRSPSLGDRRQIRLHLTAKGRALLREVRKTGALSLSRRFKDLDRGKLKRLARALREIELLLLSRSEK